MNTCSCNYYPTIVIPGIGQSKVDLYSPEGKRLKTAWPVDIDSKELIKSLAPSALKMLVTGKDEAFLKKLKAAVKAVTKDLAVNSEGVPNPLLRPVDYDKKPLSLCTEDEKRYIYKMVPLKEAAEIIGEDHLFFFAYNSFGQPYETAKELDRYIQNVKKITGHDKVNLVPVSLGGSIATAYFDICKNKNDIHRVCYFVPAVNGTSIIADTFSRSVNFENPEALLEMLVGGSSAKKLSAFLKRLPEGTLERAVSAVIDGIFETIFGNCPGMWAIMPREKYEENAARYLSGYGKGILKAKTERFHRAQMNIESLLKNEESKGVEIFSICGYGRELLPFIKGYRVNSDSVVNFTSASLFGTAAPFGESFPENYEPESSNCNEKSHNHISPDRTVDVSTSVFPDRVFCFKNQQHDDTAYNDVAISLAVRILTDDTFKDVYSDSRFPQFNGSRNTEKIKFKLLPKAYELLKLDIHETLRKELEAAVSEAQNIFGETIIENNEKASAATKRLDEAVRAATPDLRK